MSLREDKPAIKLRTGTQNDTNPMKGYFATSGKAIYSPVTNSASINSP